MKRRFYGWLLPITLACAVAFTFGVPPAEAQSLGDKIKSVLNPTPPPKKRKSTTATTKKASPTPSPSPKAKSSPSATPTPTPKAGASPKTSPSSKTTPSPTPTPEPSVTPSPTSSPSPSPKGKKKKGSPSPTPSPSATPSPSPEATPTPDSSPTVTPEASPSPGETPKPSASPEAKKERPPGVTIAPNELTDFESYSPAVKKLVESSLALAGRNLTYKYGSADPSAGGMDCSGFVYYVLRESGFTDVPRDSSQQYVWVRKAGKFEAVVSNSDDSFELAELKPGDLLFWTGTYDINRDPPITHSMIYLGREKGSGRRIMVGASDGRVYRDQSRYGVSIFDFKVSRSKRAETSGRRPTFVGYGRIPGLGDG